MYANYSFGSFLLAILAYAIISAYWRGLLKIAGIALAILFVLALIALHPWTWAAENAAERASAETPKTVEECTAPNPLGPGDPLPHLWVFKGCPAGTDYGPPATQP